MFSEALWPPGGPPTLAQAQNAQDDFPPDEPDGESIFADELDRWPLEKANLERFRVVLPGVRYDYRLGPAEGYPLHLVFLDERTARQMPGPDTPAGRIAPAALDLMWPAPQGTEADLPTLLVAPAPILGMYLLGHLLQPLVVVKGGDREARLEYEFETWSLWGPAFENVLAGIGQWRQVVILSGDVHFGYCKTLSYRRPHNAPVPARAVQFVTRPKRAVAPLCGRPRRRPGGLAGADLSARHGRKGGPFPASRRPAVFDPPRASRPDPSLGGF